MPYIAAKILRRSALIVALVVLSAQSFCLQYIVESFLKVVYTPTFATGIVTNYPCASNVGSIYDQTNCTLYMSEKGGLSNPGYAGIASQFVYCDEFFSVGAGNSSSSGKAYAPGLVTVRNVNNYVLATSYRASISWGVKTTKNGVGDLDGSWTVTMTVNPYHLDYTTGQQIYAFAQPKLYTISGTFLTTPQFSLDRDLYSFYFTTAPGQTQYEFLDAKLEFSHTATDAVPGPAASFAFIIGLWSNRSRRRNATRRINGQS